MAIRTGDDFVVRSGAAQVRIEGLGRTLRALTAAGADAQDMRQAMHRLGTIVGESAKPITPKASGRLAGSIRAGRGKTKAVVRMGGRGIRYAGVIHYGWPARNISPQPSLVRAYQASLPRVLAQLDEEIGRILEDNDLK